MTKPKPAHELTTAGAMQRLFPKEVRDWLREEIKKSNKPKRRKG
jgi:hypothetical protein